MRPNQLIPAALAFGAASLLAGQAHAVDCTTLPSPVYVVGSTAIKPVVLKLAAALAVQTKPVSLVYAGTGSCAGVSAIIDAAVAPSTSALVTPAGKSNFFTYYDGSGTAQTCDITASDAGPPVYPDIGLSDAFADSCQTLTQTLKSLGIDEHLGPVQAMTFAVPAIATQKSISAEAAYFVYGFGAKGMNTQVAPWTDLMSIFQRGPTSGTQAMIAKGIGVPIAKWYGVTPSEAGVGGTQAMIDFLTKANVGANASAIGILGAADIDPVRTNAIMAQTTPALRELAYQHTHQNCGYLPDSSANAFDKKNVRDGHYALWGPLHVFTLPHTNGNVDTIVSDLTGFTQVGSLDVIAAEAQSGLIPQCAMRVQRTTEVGDMTPLPQSAPCGCYYEKSVFQGSTSCDKCQKTADCTKASYSCQTYGGQGYCEPP